MRYFTLPKGIAPWSLAFLVATAGSLGLVGEAIAPRLVRAETTAIKVSIARSAGESYQSLVRRSEDEAIAAIESYFSRNRGARDVAISVVADNNGSLVPILSLMVSRSDWSSRPDPEAWATYLPQAERLLRIGDFAAPLPAPEPETPVVAAPPAQPTPAPTQQAPPAVPQTAPSSQQAAPPGNQTAPSPQQAAPPAEESSGGALVCDSEGCRRLE